MSNDIERIRRLHALLKLKTAVESQLERGPRMLKQLTMQIEAARKSLADVRENAKQKRIEADRKQLQLREREAKLLHHEAQLNAAKSNREYQTLKDQIAADRQANSVLSDEILETLEAIDGFQPVIDQRVEKLNQLETDFATAEKTVAERKGVLTAELERVQSEIRENLSGFGGDFHNNLKRLIAARGDESLAELDGSCCGGCNTQLTAQVRDRIEMNSAMPCPSCGRLVYLPEGRPSRA